MTLSITLIRIATLVQMRQVMNITEIYKEIGTAYSWANLSVRKLERNGYLDVEKNGRKCIVRPTATTQKLCMPGIEKLIKEFDEG
ncbi:hypothetical protein ACFL6S_00720 [Candidatus Poribacteria bacterium]